MDRRLLAITVEVPASVANLGAGFDCLALALELRNRFRLYCDLRDRSPDEKEYEFHLGGTYRDTDKRMLTPDGNLFVQAFQDARKYVCELAGYEVPRCPVLVHQEVDIAPMRGLGSSSTACVAGTLAGIKFVEAVYPRLRPNDLLTSNLSSQGSDLNDIIASLAMAVDSCPDNVCASLSGGLTYSFCESDLKVLWGRSPLLHYFHEPVEDPDLRCVALIPSVTLETPEARKTLESRAYGIHDVAFNISRSTCLPAVLRLRRYSLLRGVTQDRIHQIQRAGTLFTSERGTLLDLGHIFQAVLDAGAYAAFIGGAGSALVALVHVSNVETVAERFRRAFEEVAVGKWSVEDVLTLQITNQGAVCELKEGIPENDALVRPWFDKIGQRWFPLSKGRIKERPSVLRPKGPSLSTEHRVLGVLRQIKRVSLGECAVVGEYLRFDERVRNTLRDWRKRIEIPLVSPTHSSDNFLIWAAPGSGKSFFIQQIAESNKGRVHYEELNLAHLIRGEWVQRLAEVRACSQPTLCLLDEIDARADEVWPYEECFSDLDLDKSRKDRRAVVFVLIGSHPKGMQGMLEAMVSRRKGKDLTDRIPSGNRFEIPPLALEDRVVAFVSKLVSAAMEQGRQLRQVEQLALYYALNNPDLSTLRQLRDLAVAAIKRMSNSDDRVKYYDLFERGDSREMQLWIENKHVADELSNKFVLIEQ